MLDDPANPGSIVICSGTTRDMGSNQLLALFICGDICVEKAKNRRTSSVERTLTPQTFVLVMLLLLFICQYVSLGQHTSDVSPM